MTNMLVDHQVDASSQSRSCDILNDISVIGLHKLTKPKTSYRFVFLVTWQDGSQLTLYRKFKEVKWFQDRITLEIAGNPDNGEASKFLAKLKRKTRPGIMTKSLGTAHRLRMIDALNTYFEAVTHYFQDVNEVKSLAYFLLPSSEDKDAPAWSKDGKTFYYRSPASSVTKNDDVFVPQKRLLKKCYSSIDLLSIGSETKKKLRRTSSMNSLAVEEDYDIYIADEEHIPRAEDAEHNVIALKAGEKVQVITKNQTGWWFVRKLDESLDGRSYGYVPGSFLKLFEENNGSLDSASLKSTTSSVEETEKANDPIYETICYPLESITVSSTTRATKQPSPKLPKRPNKIKPRSPYLSLKQYKSQSPDELSFDKDELIEVLQKRPNGWWLARHNGQEGVVPAAHLRKYDNPTQSVYLQRTKFEEIFGRKI